MLRLLCDRVLLGVSMLALTGSVWAAEPQRAGLQGAPVLAEAPTATATRPAELKALRQRQERFVAEAARLAGVPATGAPYYLPLLRAGMPGRYDLWGWHGGARADRPLAAPGEEAQAARSALARFGSATRLPWYEPASRPGMLRPYDLDQRHPVRKAEGS